MRLSSLATNKDKEENGVWIDVGDGLELLLARQTNKRFQDYVYSESRSIRTKARIGAMTPNDLRPIQIQGMARFVLLDWRNLQDADGSDIPYSSEKAEELLTSYPELYRIVDELSSDVANFRAEEGAEDLKN